jgi:hypothetical protein
MIVFLCLTTKACFRERVVALPAFYRLLFTSGQKIVRKRTVPAGHHFPQTLVINQLKHAK